MPVYSRSIGTAQANATLPAWRNAMTATNTLYSVGNKSNLTELGPKIVWPGGSKPSKMGSDDDVLTMHFGFGGCVYVPEFGTHGTMVYGGTGEDIIGNQLSMVQLGQDNPGWDFWAQPEYAVTEAEAIANDGDWYYSPSAADALPANRKMALGYLLPLDWDGGFPVSLPTTIGGTGGGWVLRRKIKDTFGRNRPTRFRYNMPCHIPASMTGTGDGAILVNHDNAAGPLYFNNGKAGNVSDPGGGQPFTSAQFCEYVDGSGYQLNPLFACNTRTRQWDRLPLSAMTRGKRTGGYANSGKAVVDLNRKRVWYVQEAAAYHYVNFTNGIAGATAVDVAAPTQIVGSNFAPETETGFIATTEHPEGRLLCFQNSTLQEGDGKRNSIIVQDLDTNQIGVVNLTTRGWNRPFPVTGPVAFGYDPDTNRIFMTFFASPTHAAVSVVTWYCASFVIPSDVFNASAYSVAQVELTRAAGVSTESFSGTFKPANNAHGVFHRQLGGVIVIQQKHSYPLAFRPA